MKDSWDWEPVFCDSRHALPRQVLPLTAAPQRSQPEIQDVVSKRPECPEIRGHCVVGEIAVEHRREPPPLGRDRCMHALTQRRLDLPEPRSHPIAPGLSVEQECATSGPTADEDETQEHERLRFAQTAPRAALSRVAAKLQQARLLPVRFEPKLLEPRSHRVPEAPCIGFVLKADNDVVGIAHDNHVARCLPPSPLLGPQVEDIVQVHVRKQR